jgi:hypothetical protein
VISVLGRALATRLTLTDLFREPTVEGLARMARSKAGSAFSAIPRLEDDAAEEPAPVAHE